MIPMTLLPSRQKNVFKMCLRRISMRLFLRFILVLNIRYSDAFLCASLRRLFHAS